MYTHNHYRVEDASGPPSSNCTVIPKPEPVDNDVSPWPTMSPVGSPKLQDRDHSGLGCLAPYLLHAHDGCVGMRGMAKATYANGSSRGVFFDGRLA